MKKWYINNQGAQGLLIEEDTGRTIAVFYEKPDAGKMEDIIDLLNRIDWGRDDI